MGGNYSSLIMIALMVVVFYFLLIRPQRKRQQEQVQMQNSLTPGTRVMTTTGLFATVIAVEDDELLLEIAPGVQTRWTKAAIGRVVTPVEEKTVDNEDGERETPGDMVIDAPERRGDEGSPDKQS